MMMIMIVIMMITTMMVILTITTKMMMMIMTMITMMSIIKIEPSLPYTYVHYHDNVDAGNGDDDVISFQHELIFWVQNFTTKNT